MYPSVIINHTRTSLVSDKITVGSITWEFDPVKSKVIYTLFMRQGSHTMACDIEMSQVDFALFIFWLCCLSTSLCYQVLLTLLYNVCISYEVQIPSCVWEERCMYNFCETNFNGFSIGFINWTHFKYVVTVLPNLHLFYLLTSPRSSIVTPQIFPIPYSSNLIVTVITTLIFLIFCINAFY